MFLFPIFLNVIVLRILLIFGYLSDMEKLIPFKTVVSKATETEASSTEIRESWFQVPQLEVSEDLDTFYSELNTFSGISGFLYKEFEVKYRILKAVLAHLEKGVAMEHDSLIVVNQLLFTKRTFDSLVLSMKLLSNIDQHDTPIHSLIRNVIGYKVMVLTFFNSHGSLNVNIEHLSEKISLISDDLAFLESQFRLLEDVRIDLTIVFDFEITDVKQIIEELRSQLPSRKKSLNVLTVIA